MSTVMSQIQAITAPLKAKAMAALSLHPMATVPSMASVLSGLGVPSNISASGAPTANAYTIHQYMNTSVTVPNRLPPDPIKPVGVPSPSENAIPNTGTSTLAKITNAQIAALKADDVNAVNAYFASFNSPITYATMSQYNQDQFQSYYETWLNDLIAKTYSSEQVQVRTLAKQILATTPNAADRTPDQQAVIAQAKANLKALKANSPEYQAYDAASFKRYQFNTWYEQAYSCWLAGGSSLSLSADVQAQLSKYL
jgi:hypothetical protein